VSRVARVNVVLGVRLLGAAGCASEPRAPGIAIEWLPEEIRWYVDGELYQTRTPGDCLVRGSTITSSS
jgi:hypothetical protein